MKMISPRTLRFLILTIIIVTCAMTLILTGNDTYVEGFFAAYCIYMCGEAFAWFFEQIG